MLTLDEKMSKVRKEMEQLYDLYTAREKELAEYKSFCDVKIGSKDYGKIMRKFDKARFSLPEWKTYAKKHMQYNRLMNEWCDSPC